MRKLAIIGHFGGENRFFDGQTVKTVTLYEELKKTGMFDIRIVDTYYNNTNKLKLLFDTVKNVLACKDVIVLLSHNGMKVYFPLLCFFAKVFGKNVYHDIIGGNLPDLISENKSWVRYLNSFKVNWIELNSVKEKLDAIGLKNVEVLPNFKKITALDKSEIQISDNEVLKLCTFSRVMKEKGIEDAIEAVKMLNDSGKKCSLSIFGQIDPGYEERFSELSKTFPEYIEYGGVIDFNKSVETLSKFDLLLFPTHYYTEGFPGTLLDSFASGLPVVAPDIPAVKELVFDNISGVLYPFRDNSQFAKVVGDLYDDREKINRMKCACIDEYEKYRPDFVMGTILNKLGR